MTSLISNPPYNMKWNIPPFAQMQPRFNGCYELPPEENANYAFILTAIAEADRAVLLLPCSVLQGEGKKEKEIRKYLVDKNLIEAVILNPNKMFEATDIATCILVLDRNKQNMDIVMVDMRENYTVEEREQNGQFGGKAHEGRTYVKKVNTFSKGQIEKILSIIKEKSNESGVSKCISCQNVANKEYTLLASYYIDLIEEENAHRPYEDILDDLNRTIKDKNILKLTINETIAKSIGLYEFGRLQKESRVNAEQLSENMEKMFGKKVLKDDYISLTKNKMEIKFENTSKEKMTPIFRLILQMYKQHIMYLNEEENRYLIELRTAMLSELMSGKLTIPDE